MDDEKGSQAISKGNFHGWNKHCVTPEMYIIQVPDSSQLKGPSNQSRDCLDSINKTEGTEGIEHL